MKWKLLPEQVYILKALARRWECFKRKRHGPVELVWSDYVKKRTLVKCRNCGSKVWKNGYVRLACPSYQARLRMKEGA